MNDGDRPKFGNSVAPWMAALAIKTRLRQGGLSSMKELKQVHACLVRCSLEQDQYLVNLVLRFGFALGDTSYACRVFEQTRGPNIFLWNSTIRGLVENGCYRECIEFYETMRKQERGVIPDHFTFPFVLKACAGFRDYAQGRKVHDLVFKLGVDENEFVRAAVVDLYAKCGCLESALKMFDDISCRSVVPWTAIITGYVRTGKCKEAIAVFKRLLGMGLKPDSLTVVRVLSACSKIGDLASGVQIDGYVTGVGMERNLFLATSLMDLYVKCGSMENACRVFEGTKEKDIVSWSAMIQGYALNGMPKESINYFFKMLSEDLLPDCYAMVGFLGACARLGALELGHWASSFLMDRSEFLTNPVLGTALIDMYAKCGSMARAWEVFRGIEEKDRVVLNVAISGLAMNGHVRTASGVFCQMEKLGVKPDENTFMGLLSGCAHAGLVHEGRLYFNNMIRSLSQTPTIEHYGCMVDLLGRAGLLEEACSLIRSMPMEANAVVWGALLAGCRLHRHVQLAEYVQEKLMELDPWNSGNHVLLSNIYSSSRRWKDAANIRSMMKETGIQKIRGCSWIEVSGIVHEFLVGDTSHPFSEKIYSKLQELAGYLREAGYVPSVDDVLFDVEEEEKEHFLGCHSEKLAVAFGLVSSPQGNLPIRVVKNLRVCGDCHEAIKLISKITNREIVVRDTNRFHSFSDGSCSCKDYW